MRCTQSNGCSMLGGPCPSCEPDDPSQEMSEKEKADLQVWLRHGRIGTGRGYQAEVERAYRIEADSQ